MTASDDRQMIYLGIDDTDMPGTPGTNQLARAICGDVADEWRCVRIVRHQLLEDARVPCTSKNGSASIVLQPLREQEPADELPCELIDRVRRRMQAWLVPGSDPGLCIARRVPPAVEEFGRRCQRELVHQEEARRLAATHGIHLEGLGGTEGGVIGALAAVGLAWSDNDGRVVQIGTWPDDCSGVHSAAALHARGVEIRELTSDRLIGEGQIDVGKHLRPNRRGGRTVLYVRREEPDRDAWQAVRLP